MDDYKRSELYFLQALGCFLNLPLERPPPIVFLISCVFIPCVFFLSCVFHNAPLALAPFAMYCNKWVLE